MTFMRRVTFALLALFAFSPAAAELPPQLDRALAQGEMANAVRWAFTQQVNFNDVELTMRFWPASESGTWQLVSPAQDALSEDETKVYELLTDLPGDPDPDSDLTYEQLRISIGDQELEVVEDTQEHTIYGFAPRPWDDIENDEVGFIEHMRAEITVDKDGGYVSRIRMFSTGRFRHMVVARIDSFEQVMLFEPEAMTGFPLMSSFNQQIEGSALFQHFSQSREEAYGDFTPMTSEGVAITCSPATCAQELSTAE